MSKYFYGITKQEARDNFIHYLASDYYEFLDNHGYIDDERYELYFDYVYDEYGSEKIGCTYICYFRSTRVDFDDLDSARLYSLNYFYDYCISIFESSFYSLVKDGIFSRLSFTVFDGLDSFEKLFSTDLVTEIFDWLNLSPGHILNLHLEFYTNHDFYYLFSKEDNAFKPILSIFRDYLFNELDMDLVDLCDFDFVFDFLRLQESLTRYTSGLFSGCNYFFVKVFKE